MGCNVIYIFSHRQWLQMSRLPFQAYICFQTCLLLMDYGLAIDYQCLDVKTFLFWKGINAPMNLHSSICIGTFRLLSHKTHKIYNENLHMMLGFECNLSWFTIGSVLTQTTWDLGVAVLIDFSWEQVCFASHSCIQSAFFLVWGLVTWDAVEIMCNTPCLLVYLNLIS